MRPGCGRVREGELGLWLGETGTVTSGVGGCTLTTSEQRRMERLADPAARRSFATAHELMSHAVRTQSPGWHVVQRCARCGGDHGQPRVRGPGGQTGWHVSLSHCRSMCAVALARTRIGVDVERVDETSSAGLAAVLTRREQAAMGAFVPGRADGVAPYLWCAKEALGKALGVGLEGAEGRDLLDVASHAAEHPGSWVSWSGWSFLAFGFGADHRGAVAIEGHPLDVAIHQIPER